MGKNHSLSDQLPDHKDIIFFDGVCNLCNGAVNFILDRDEENNFLFASLQSDKARQILHRYDYDPSRLSSILVVTREGRLLDKSDAALYIAKHLPGAWKFLTIFRFIPRFLRDLIYDLIAKNRYRLFGRRDQCRLPTPELKQRFLEG